MSTEDEWLLKAWGCEGRYKLGIARGHIDDVNDGAMAETAMPQQCAQLAACEARIAELVKERDEAKRLMGEWHLKALDLQLELDKAHDTIALGVEIVDRDIVALAERDATIAELEGEVAKMRAALEDIRVAVRGEGRGAGLDRWGQPIGKKVDVIVAEALGGSAPVSERAAIVAYLRRESTRFVTYELAESLRIRADAIESGAHLDTEKKR